MNKTLVLSIGIIIVIGLFVLAYRLTSPAGIVTQKPTTSSSTGQNAGFPVAIPIVSPAVTTSAPASQATTSVGTVQTDTVIQDPATVKDPINPGYYYLGYHTSVGASDPTATNNPPYIITYISATEYFNIALLQEPIGPVRLEAEQYLMAHLGISQSQMCQLDYMVSVPVRVNSQFAGSNLGFSFCPGATVLPK